MSYLQELFAKLDGWGALGVVGQLIFACRFLVQWVASEKKRESTIPVAFWWISIFGAILVLVYGIQRRELPIILGQAFGFVVYIRNLVLIYGNRARSGASTTLRSRPVEIVAEEPAHRSGG